MRKVITSTMLAMFVALSVGADNVFAGNIPPYEPPVEAELTVKWGNVSGTVYEANKVSFDGSLSVSKGRVQIIDTLKFEQHDDDKDRITRKQNPVAWKSWIFNHWDGVKATIKADPRALVTVKTDFGSLTVPYAKLLTAPRNTKLSFGDGREIVLNVKKIHTDPFYLYTIWGGPIYSATDEAEATRELEEVSDKLLRTETAAEFKAVLDSRPDIQRPGDDFSGALAFENGANGKLVETILFEAGHGDKITERGENYVAWDSYIFGHYDGLFLKAQLDQTNPIDDTVAIKFGELGFSEEVSLAGLYVYGVHTMKIEHDGQTYLVGMIAVKKPFCDLRMHTASPSICDPDPEPAPVPLPLPTPLPQPVPIEPTVLEAVKVEPVKLNTAVRVDAVKVLAQ